MNDPHNAIASSGQEVTTQRSTLQMSGLTVLAVLLYAALFDAAVETFVSGSPLRWIVGETVAAYVALSALVWRKLSWMTKVSLSFFVLFGLMVFAAWRPEGSDSPLTLLGQTTSTLLSAATILGIVLAGWILARMKFLPWPARVALILLALYGVAGFVVGIMGRTPYAALLHGESLWERLPFWLQGGFVGAVIVVPVAVLIQLASVTSRIRTGQLLAWGRQVSALGLCAAVAAAGLVRAGAPDGIRMFSEQGTPLPPGAFDLNGLSAVEKSGRRKQLAAYMEKLYQELDRTAQQIPREEFDAQAVVNKVGNDPRKLFAWVHDNTQWVPYRGALRGSTGVLMDHFGNSLDRSLLLAELLRLSGHVSRLARADLSEEQGRKLLAKVPSPPIRQEPPALAQGKEATSPSDAVIKAAGLSAPEFQWVTEGLRKLSRVEGAEYEREVKETKRRVDEQAHLLQAALGQGGLLAQQDAMLAAVRDHWWVQLEENGNWTDLDLLSADPQSGERPAQPSETFGAEAGGKIQLASEFCHEMVIRVVVEQWKEKQLHAHVALQHAMRPSEIIGEPVTLTHVPTKWPSNLGSDKDRDSAGAFETAVVGQQDWIPVLRIGKKVFAGNTFNTAGEFVEQGEGPSGIDSVAPGASQADKLGAGAGGGMLGELGGSEDAEQTPKEKTGKGQLTAEWIEYELHTPGSQPRTFRHAVFDLLGPGVRNASAPSQPQIGPMETFGRGLALLDKTEMLPLVCDLSPAFVADMLYRQLQEWREPSLKALHEENPAQRQELLSTMPAPTRALSPLYSYALARKMLSPVVGSVFQDSIGLVNYRVEGHPNGKGGLEFRGLTDIVANQVGFLPGSALTPFTARLQQGVADTAAEHLAVGSSSGIGNTTTVFALASARGLATVVVRSPSERAWRDFQASPDVRARVEQDLTEGYAVVLPQKAVQERLGWWRVDPQTGSAVGVMDAGFHQELTEKIDMDVALADTRISALEMKTPTGPPPGFWSRHVDQILWDLGWRWEFSGDAYLEVAGRIIDAQWEIVRAGLMGSL